MSTIYEALEKAEIERNVQKIIERPGRTQNQERDTQSAFQTI